MTVTARQGRTIRGLDAEQRQAQRRDQLLDAALSLFTNQGYAHTTIEQICQTAFVGTKGFYELFSSKEHCYLALLRTIAEDIGAAMVATVDPPPADEPEAARALLTSFAHAVADDPRKVKAAFGEGAGISPAVDWQRRLNRRWGVGLVEQVWDHYGVGQSRPDRHVVAVALVGGLFDLVVDWLSTTGPDVEPEADDLAERLLVFYDVIRRGLS